MWNSETNIRGPAGPKGADGAQGLPGADGAPGLPGADGATVPPATAVPLVESGTGAVGVSTKYAREDHVHPLGPGGGGGAAVLVSDTPPVGAADNSLWFESDTGMLYIRYNDGTSTQWVVVPPGVSAASLGAATVTYVDAADAALQAAIDNRVRYDAAQALTEAQKVQARSNVYAAPFDALAYNGMQINGSMDVSQELGATVKVLTNTAGYVIDGWAASFTGAGATASVSQVAITSLSGFPYCLQMNCTAANNLAASLDGSYFYQHIEGWRFNSVYFGHNTAKQVTIGFWVFPNISGTMAVSVRNPTDRAYVVDVPVTAGAWQYKTVTIGPGPGGGTFNRTNGIGATITFCFGAGAGRKGAAGAWGTNSNVIASAATTNFFATTGVIYLTGVVVLPGIEVPDATRSPYITRPYDQELLTCQRYLKMLGASSLTGQFVTASRVVLFASYGVPFRTTPTSTLLTTTPNITEIGVGTRTGTGSSLTEAINSEFGGHFDITGFSGALPQNPAVGGTNPIVKVDARL